MGLLFIGEFKTKEWEFKAPDEGGGKKVSQMVSYHDQPRSLKPLQCGEVAWHFI